MGWNDVKSVNKPKLFNGMHDNELKLDNLKPIK